ncbi:MAG: 4'-phosphopantetheinyl transferase superfamily protein, partial [Desulfofustis sp.]|nr:4'-phosphopantetheinyl transferase superfamily protein [Desulfofustis sp.]
MIDTPSEQIGQLLPDDLRFFLSSRAPGNNLATALSDTVTMGEQQLSQLVTTWLTDHERECLDRFSFPKRRSEWLSGRICAKRAILDLLSGQSSRPLSPLDISIEVGSSGRPSVVISERPRLFNDLDISISHSQGKAIGIAGHGLCGVDIQHLNDTLFRVKSRFCDEFEMALLENVMESDLVQLGLLWVSKEAIRKCFSALALLGFLEIHLERISVDRGYRLLSFYLVEPLSSIGTISVTTHLHGSY